MDNEALARIEAAIADMRSDMDRRFDDVERGVVKLEETVAKMGLELGNEIRKGDEETRSELKTLTRNLRVLRILR